MDLLGKFVKHKEDGQIGKITYSSFGYSIHTIGTYDDDGIEKAMFMKYLGDSWKNHSKHWELIEEIPDTHNFELFGVPTTEEIHNIYYKEVQNE